MKYKVDFHIHTTCSDGIYTPVEIVKMYKDKEYDMIAITDHDGVDGIKEAQIAGEALEIQVVPGIEMSTAYDFNGKEIELHILGYYIDPENQPLLDKLKEIRAGREERNERLLAHLNEKGYELTMDEVLERPGQTFVGKPNFKRALERKGYNTDNIWDTFDEVYKKKISTERAIYFIKGAGGIPVLAHPRKTKGIGDPNTQEFMDNLEFILRDLKKKGLKGLECFHPSADQHQATDLAVLAGKLHLHITQGSDFHGDK